MCLLHEESSLHCTRPYSHNISTHSLDWGLVHEWGIKPIVLFAGVYSMSGRLKSTHTVEHSRSQGSQHCKLVQVICLALTRCPYPTRSGRKHTTSIGYDLPPNWDISIDKPRSTWM